MTATHVRITGVKARIDGLPSMIALSEPIVVAKGAQVSDEHPVIKSALAGARLFGARSVQPYDLIGEDITPTVLGARIYTSDALKGNTVVAAHVGESRVLVREPENPEDFLDALAGVPEDDERIDGYYLYSTPEGQGFRTIATACWSEESYQFDVTVLFQHIASGAFYLGSDSGCSCPAPGENWSTMEDLTRVRKLQDLIDYLEETKTACLNAYTSEDEVARLTGEVADCISAYMAAKKGR